MQRPEKFYHGSYENFFQAGDELCALPASYEKNWAGTGFYDVLEHYRPKDKLAHKHAVFMVDNIDDVDNAGAPTDAIYEVEPIGDVQRYDMNWSTEISGIIACDGAEAWHTDRVKGIAEAYWSGLPYPDRDSVWEYLAPRMKIVQLVHCENEPAGFDF